MKHLYLVLLFCLLHPNANAGNILKSYRTAGDSAMSKEQFQKANLIFTKGIDEARRLGNDTFELYFLANSGFCLEMQGNLNGALKIYYMVLPILEKRKDSIALADLMMNMGIILKQQSQFLPALPLLLKSSALYEKILERDTSSAVRNQHLEWLASCYNSIGYIRNLLQDTALSIGYSKKALAIQARLGKREDMAKTLDCIGVFFLQNKQYDSAIFYLQRALRLKKKSGHAIPIATTLMNIGSVYDSLNKLEQAITVFKEAFALQLAAKNLLGLSASCAHIAAYMQQQNKIDSAFYFVNLGLPVAQSLGIKEDICTYYDVRRKLFHQTGQYQKALLDAETYIELNRELIEINESKRLAALMIKHARDETESKEAIEKERTEKEMERAEAAKTRWLYSSLLLLLIFALTLLLYLNNRKRKQQIEVLLRELNHRVKNNLQMMHSVMGLQQENLQSDAARNVLDENRQRIWAMMLVHRRLYAGSNNTDTDIKEYLENLVTEAVAAQGYENSLTLQMEIAPHYMQTDLAITLGLIVNELMSNAFKYAFPGNPSPKLTLRLQKNKDQLELSFADNGATQHAPETKRQNAFGLRLIETLCKQMEAPYSFTYANGTHFNLSLKIK